MVKRVGRAARLPKATVFPKTLEMGVRAKEAEAESQLFPYLNGSMERGGLST